MLTLAALKVGTKVGMLVFWGKIFLGLNRERLLYNYYGMAKMKANEKLV
jgi:hypothetical protein